MIYLAFLCHTYQPPTQSKKVLSQIDKECYQPWSKIITFMENAAFTVNINYSLTEQLLENGFYETLGNLEQTARDGKIEFTGSAAYHAILPLIPEEEAYRQIQVNYEENRKVFGEVYEPSGFFPPEMCFSQRVADIVVYNGYKWTITDDLVFGEHHGKDKIPFDYIPTVNSLPVFQRSRFWSDRVSSGEFHGHQFVAEIKRGLSEWFRKYNKEDGYLIVATDTEIYGHHYKWYEQTFLQEMLESLQSEKEITLCKISDLLDKFPPKEKYVPDGSWSTSVDDWRRGDVYPLWKSPFNVAHDRLWKLLNYVLSCAKNALARYNNMDLRKMVDKILYSCPPWWAARRPFFDPVQVMWGANLQLETLGLCLDLEKEKGIAKWQEGYNLYQRVVHSLIEASENTTQRRRTLSGAIYYDYDKKNVGTAEVFDAVSVGK